MKGYSLIEVTVVMSLFLVLVTLVSANLFRFQHTSQLSSTVTNFLSDYKEQQIKAMVGDTEGNSTPANYGVHLDSTSYTLFRNTYGTSNLPISLPSTVTVSTTFSSSQIVFQKGSGEVGSTGTITFRDTVNGSQKQVSINKYGVVTAVN
jgi:prepilin-type N-terminal cleavage/methylation domain-containing protein